METDIAEAAPERFTHAEACARFCAHARAAATYADAGMYADARDEHAAGRECAAAMVDLALDAGMRDAAMAETLRASGLQDAAGLALGHRLGEEAAELFTQAGRAAMAALGAGLAG